jgi:hypothetical protein
MSTCIQCGAEFETRFGKRPSRVCSVTCRVAANTQQGARRYSLDCAKCDRLFYSPASERKYCSPDCSIAARKRIARTCKQCSQAFLPKAANRTDYCSRECYFAAKAKKPKPTTCRVYFPQCVQCRDIFTAKRQGNRFCSDRCGMRFHYEQSKQDGRYRAMLSKKREQYIAVPGTRRQCARCHGPFTSNKHTAIYCATCSIFVYREQRTDQNHRRSIRERGAFVAPVSRTEIYKRDGWRCGICHRAVDPKLRYPDPTSASIDHIIPIARGGTHEPRNVRLAHWICNVRRSDSMANTQLRLI